LILTDGDIHDMRETKSLIVAASELPCAIVIVGVGEHSFEDMDKLDSDNELLRDDYGKVAKRDIV
jgi:Copine